MERFRLLIDLEAISFIESLAKSARRHLTERLVQIRSSPQQFSDCAELDSVGRRVEINICGGYAIKYWIDHADRQVKVLDVYAADRVR